MVQGRAKRVPFTLAAEARRGPEKEAAGAQMVVSGSSGRGTQARVARFFPSGHSLFDEFAPEEMLLVASVRENVLAQAFLIAELDQLVKIGRVG